jgi:hypothetical protein
MKKNTTELYRIMTEANEIRRILDGTELSASSTKENKQAEMVKA